jgi:hypothetical protein
MTTPQLQAGQSVVPCTQPELVPWQQPQAQALMSKQISNTNSLSHNAWVNSTDGLAGWVTDWQTHQSMGGLPRGSL